MTVRTARRMLTSYGLLAAALISSTASAQEAPAKAAPDAAAPDTIVSHGQITVAGHPLRYRATVERHLVDAPDGKPAASIYTFSYEREGGRGRETRPVIFAFNGGPGSASLWLHLGLLGPYRIASLDSLTPTTVAPFTLVENADTPLDVADIVLIDPVGTGYSRMLPAGKPEQFLGTEADARVTVGIIERWLREHGRMNAPKYLVSESYGTIRAAVVAKMLAGGPTATGGMDGITLNGLVLLGPALDLPDDPMSDIAQTTTLPTLAAIACYHGKGPKDCTPQGAAAAGRALVGDGYLDALYRGADLDAAAKADLATRLGVLTGIPRTRWLTQNLRIGTTDFAQSLLASQGVHLGIYDGRYSLDAANPGGDPVADDPAMGRYVPAFVGAMNAYARRTLRVASTEEYRPIAFRDVNARWDYGNGPGKRASHNYAVEIGTALRRNPALKVMIGNGYYDLATPFGQTEHAVAQAGIARTRVIYRYYPSGHMSYLGAASRHALAQDIRDLITGRLSPAGDQSSR